VSLFWLSERQQYLGLYQLRAAQPGAGRKTMERRLSFREQFGAMVARTRRVTELEFRFCQQRECAQLVWIVVLCRGENLECPLQMIARGRGLVTVPRQQGSCRFQRAKG
jgi:hypothetical protein